MPKNPGYATDQGFPNSVKWLAVGAGGENLPNFGGMENFARVGFFCQVVGF